MSWKLLMSWLLGILLVSSAPLASAYDTPCQLCAVHSCCPTAVSSECPMLRCSPSTACNGTMHRQTVDAIAPRGDSPLASSIGAEQSQATFQALVALSFATADLRLNPPLRNSSGFDPLLVRLQV